MKEDGPNKPHRLTTTMKDFIRFLQAKTSNHECPACGNKMWTIAGFVGQENAARFNLKIEDVPNASSVSSLGCSCNECGFMRFHMAHVVHEWLEANPAAQQELDLNDGEASSIE